VDLRRQGSGSTGATNVLRTLGPAYAVPVLLLDVGKGALAAYLGLRYLELGALGALIAGAAAVAGHNWSAFLRFRGGKGVASSAGVVLVAFPWLLAVALGVFILTVVATRYVSLGSILGAWAAFLLSLTPEYTLVARIPVLVLVVLITYQHRANIKRLLSGTENKIGQKVRKDGASS
jgi:glycerol-3-phosphate acyltransferase PlsY